MHLRVSVCKCPKLFLDVQLYTSKTALITAIHIVLINICDLLSELVTFAYSVISSTLGISTVGADSVLFSIS